MTGEQSEEPFDEAAAVGEAMEMLNNGEIRTDITCQEARQEWFITARGFFIEGKDPRVPIDVEVGIHIGKCDTKQCSMLWAAYENILKTTPQDKVDFMTEFINELEQNINATNN